MHKEGDAARGAKYDRGRKSTWKERKHEGGEKRTNIY